MPRSAYRIGCPRAGRWREVLNTDSRHYAGSNLGNAGELTATAKPSHGQPYSLELTVPPLAVIWLRHES